MPPFSLPLSRPAQRWACFTLGVIDREQLSDWVTAQFLEAEEVDDHLVDLSCLLGMSHEDITRKLQEAASLLDSRQLGRVQLGLIGEMFAEKRWNAARAVGALALTNFNWDEVEGEAIYEIEDVYRLAADGIYGTVVDAEERLVEFLAPYRPYFLDPSSTPKEPPKRSQEPAGS